MQLPCTLLVNLPALCGLDFPPCFARDRLLSGQRGGGGHSVQLVPWIARAMCLPWLGCGTWCPPTASLLLLLATASLQLAVRGTGEAVG